MGFAFVHCILSPPCLLSCPGSLVSRALCGVSWVLVPPKVLYSFPIECLLALAHIIYASAYESIIVLNSPHKMQLTISVWKPWCCTTSNQSQQISPAQHLSMCNPLCHSLRVLSHTTVKSSAWICLLSILPCSVRGSTL